MAPHARACSYKRFLFIGSAVYWLSRKCSHCPVATLFLATASNGVRKTMAFSQLSDLSLLAKHFVTSWSPLLQ